MRIFHFILLSGICFFVVSLASAATFESRSHVIGDHGTSIQTTDGVPADPQLPHQPDQIRGDYVWRSTHENIIGSSVGVSRWPGRYDVMVGHENYPPTPVEVFDAAGEGVPYWIDSGQYSQIAARAGVYALADYHDPAGISLVCWGADLVDPLWTYELPGCSPAGFSNTLQINMNATYVCYGCFSAGAVRLIVVEAATGTVLVDTPIPLDGPSLRNMSVSDDGNYVDLNCGAWHVVYDVAANAERARVNVQASTNPCGISETGEWIVAGFSTAKAFQWDAQQGAYVQRWVHSGAGHYAGAMMVSERGYWIVGWYSSSYNKNRIQRFDLADGANPWTRDLPISSGTVQDLPVAVDYTRDRDLIAFGFWGDTELSSPEILVIDTDGREEYSCHAPGSMYDVAIAEDGSYVAATGKLVHANVMGSGSDAYCGQVLELAAVDRIDDTFDAGFACASVIASPNPFNGTTTLRAALPAGANGDMGQLCIFDVDGRIVRALNGSVSGTALSAEWDGCDGQGQALPAGVYYSKFLAGRSKSPIESGAVRLILVR